MDSATSFAATARQRFETVRAPIPFLAKLVGRASDGGTLRRPTLLLLEENRESIMSNTKTPKDAKTTDDKEEQVIAEQFEGLDNDLVNVGKFTDPEADAGSPDAKRDHADEPEVSNDPAIETSNTLKRP
ncbi:hypothetical protein [Aureimonas sp. AU20]|uniref:hypothetical protein n=1 Tax=Aureimonas sp. AU20 TaxID=1349819 RepID=UPI0007211784|nr:hypothetical protein [Aureimonas sp. AU20]ALN75237.1 hypothetical protein M673_21115 [Aureimonas sp. AU20]